MIDSPPPPGDHEATLAEVRRDGAKADPAVVRVLVNADYERIDARLLELFGDSDLKFDVANVLSRILVARDPDRDPEYILAHLRSLAQLNPFASRARRREERPLENPAVMAFSLGFSKLRQADPVGVYGRQLRYRFWGFG